MENKPLVLCPHGKEKPKEAVKRNIRRRLGTRPESQLVMMTYRFARDSAPFHYATRVKITRNSTESI